MCPKTLKVDSQQFETHEHKAYEFYTLMDDTLLPNCINQSYQTTQNQE